MYMGIDPGDSGGIAILDKDGNSVLVDKFKDKTEQEIRDLFVKHKVKVAYLEKVHSMPGQGVASSFKFGTSYGFLRGLLVAFNIKREFVTPQKWQKHLGCLTRGDKKVTRTKAQEMFPSVKITHAVADALLIAHYCYLVEKDK